MKTKIFVVLVFPKSCGILKMELLGRLAGEFLLSSLNEWREADVRVAINGNVDVRSLFEKFENLAECRLVELCDAMQAGRGLLVIDARARICSVALTDILAHVGSVANSVQILESSTDIVASHRGPMTLAVYLPPEMICRDLFVCEQTSNGGGLEQILKSDVFDNASTVTCPQLRVSHFALMLVSEVDLAELERHLLLSRAIDAMKQGVRIHDPNSVYIRGDLVCGAGVTLEPNVIVEGVVVLGDGVMVGANSILRNCQVGANTSINPFSLVEQSSIGSGSFIGPYGRIRPGSVIGDNVQIGNYVEIKNAKIGDGSRINHHTFIGDALLAKQVTIGAGTITCNHDGVGTHQTVIEHGAYVGSGCNLVAPLSIGENAVVGAGSTITHNVPAGKLAIARQQQTIIEHWLGPKTRRQEK